MQPNSITKTAPFDRYHMLLRLQIGVAIGCIFILCYPFQFLHSGAMIRIASVGILIAGASLFTGFVLGFIFCIPRTTKSSEAVTASSGSLPTNSGSNFQSSAIAVSDIETNTNLVDISDWLTKILVGVGLVELNTIPHHLKTLAIFLGPGLRANENGLYVLSSQSFGLGVVIFYFSVGFLIGYLWTRLYFQSALSQLADYARRIDEAWSDATTAELLMKDGNLSEAMRVVDDALRSNPANAKALFTKGRILKRLAQVGGKPGDPSLLKDALSYVSTAAVLLPDKGAPTYNVACYKTLLGYDQTEIFDDLRKAIKINPIFREDAKTDEDLQSLRENEQFMKIIQSVA